MPIFPVTTKSRRSPAFLLMGAAWVLAVGAIAPVKAAGPGNMALHGAVPHRALYEIRMIEARNGNQIQNIAGKMYYEWKPSCAGWITEHRFDLYYEYADSPGMHVTSAFSTVEDYEGDRLSFTARRRRNGTVFQELRGQAEKQDGDGGSVTYSDPSGANIDLEAGTMFPIEHSLALLEASRRGETFFVSQVFDGSDEDGPRLVNAFIGDYVDASPGDSAVPGIDPDLAAAPARRVRLAFFPEFSQDSSPDYEMTAHFHDNGVISHMKVEYNDFTVRQKLVALEAVTGQDCQAAPPRATEH